MSFALILLGKNPDKLSELRNEVDSVIGPQARDLEAEDLKKLQYTEWVIKETLRLFPVGIGTVRRNEEELELGGHRIPANVSLIDLMVGSLAHMCTHTEWFVCAGVCNPTK